MPSPPHADSLTEGAAFCAEVAPMPNARKSTDAPLLAQLPCFSLLLLLPLPGGSAGECGAEGAGDDSEQSTSVPESVMTANDVRGLVDFLLGIVSAGADVGDLSGRDERLGDFFPAAAGLACAEPGPAKVAAACSTVSAESASPDLDSLMRLDSSEDAGLCPDDDVSARLHCSSGSEPSGRRGSDKNGASTSCELRAHNGGEDLLGLRPVVDDEAEDAVLDELSKRAAVNAISPGLCGEGMDLCQTRSIMSAMSVASMAPSVTPHMLQLKTVLMMSGMLVPQRASSATSSRLCRLASVATKAAHCAKVRQ